MGKFFDRLTRKQQLFVMEYIADGDQKRAVIEAGYRGTKESLSVMGSKLLAKKEIQQAIHEVGVPIFEEQQLTVENLAKQLSLYVYRDMGDLLDDDYCLRKPLSQLPESVRQCIEECQIDNEYDRETGELTRQRVRVKLVSKIKAMELAMRYMNMLSPDTTVNINHTQINWNQFYGLKVDKDSVEQRVITLEQEG